LPAFAPIWAHVRRHRRLVLWGALALLITDLGQQAIPLLLKHALDDLKGGAALGVVALWAFLRVGVVLFQAAFRYGWRWGLFGMARRVEAGLRHDVFAKFLRLPPAFYLKHRLGELLSRAMSDLAIIRESLGFGWMALLDSVTMVSLTLIFMLKLDASLTLRLLLPMILLPVLIMTLGRKVRQLSREAQAALDELSQAATESFRGARVIHAYGRQNEETARFLAKCDFYRQRNMRAVRLEAVYWPLLTVVAGMSELALFYWGGQAMSSGRITLGTFVALNDYLIQITWPVMALGFSSNLYVRGKVSVERLNEVLDAPQGMAASPDNEGAASDAAALLEFRSLHYAYEQGPEVLKGVDLSVKPGEWVGLCGPTGSGKSSLLRLAARLDDPRSGQIFLDRLPLPAWSLPELRRQLGVVMQEPTLFSETVFENIAFGAAAGEASLSEALRCARLADLHDQIAALPQGYDTLLGEKGVNLSGGQKQRLALARALYLKPRLLLLDDAFSAVDTATEERIVSGLRQALPGSSVLLISHRSSTLRLCDRVVTLEAGKVSEQGTHSELLQREGWYFSMNRREQLAAKAGLS